MKSYQDFLASKAQLSQSSGFEVAPEEINPWLKGFNRDIVRWALHGGRRAIFAAFGLHKTAMQLEIGRLVSQKTGGKFLIVAPLGVRQEFKRDAKKLGIEIRFVKKTEELSEDCDAHRLVSVEQGQLDAEVSQPSDLDGVSATQRGPRNWGERVAGGGNSEALQSRMDGNGSRAGNSGARQDGVEAQRRRGAGMTPTFSDIMRELWRADVPITESIEECHARLIARWPSLAAVIR